MQEVGQGGVENSLSRSFGKCIQRLERRRMNRNAGEELEQYKV